MIVFFDYHYHQSSFLTLRAAANDNCENGVTLINRPSHSGHNCHPLLASTFPLFVCVIAVSIVLV